LFATFQARGIATTNQPKSPPTRKFFV